MIRLLKVWIAAVQAHVPGEVDPPLATISTLNREDLLRLQPFAQALIGLVPDPRRVRVSRIQIPNADTAEVRMLASTAAAILVIKIRPQITPITRIQITKTHATNKMPVRWAAHWRLL